MRDEHRESRKGYKYNENVNKEKNRGHKKVDTNICRKKKRNRERFIF